MRSAFLLSIRLSAAWYVEAFGSLGRFAAPLRARRLAVLLIGFPLFGLFQTVHWIGFLIDEILFRGYRKVPVRNPLFITGVPRSGTTFLHRTLSRDSSQFRTFQTWEAVLAPSITERKLLRLLSRLDRFLGRPLQRLVEGLTRRLAGGLDDIHKVDLTAPEEDYLTLLPASGCFILSLAFPSSPSVWLLARFQDMPEERRAVLVRFYHRCLQKHLYVHGTQCRLLSKNAAFASWVPDLRQVFPDARFLFCIREPQSVLSSQLSSVRSGMRLFDTEPALDTFSLEFQTVLAHAYRVLRDEMRSFLPDHLAILDQADLKGHTGELLTIALKRLCVDLTPDLVAAITEADALSRQYVSRHHHAPVRAKSGPQEFQTCVQPLYEEMIQKAVRP